MHFLAYWCAPSLTGSLCFFLLKELVATLGRELCVRVLHFTYAGGYSGTPTYAQ